jgi:hypothetical protein
VSASTLRHWNTARINSPNQRRYALPDDAVADNPAAKFYKYTMLQDQVVLVDPTRMRVIDVIGPTPKQ